MQRMIFFVFALFFFCGVAFGKELPEIKEDKDRVSYSLGYQIGGDLHKQQMGLHDDAFLKGVKDALSSANPEISPEEMQSILKELKGKILTEKRREQHAAIENYRGDGKKFLDQNAKKKGVTVLPSGLQYKILRPGTGKTPKSNNRVNVHYRGTLVDGQEFYNSRRGKETPDTFHVGAVVKGLSEALQLMREGGQWQIFVPENLAYGERGPVGERAVIFYVELISIVPNGS